MSKLLFCLAFTLFSASAVRAEYFELCAGIPDGSYIPILEDCHSYIYCSDNVNESFKDECPEGSYFEAASLECVLDEQNVCPTNDEVLWEESSEEESMANIETTQTTSTSSDRDVTLSTTSAALIPTTAPAPASSTPSLAVSDNFPTPRPVCKRNVDSYYPHYERCEYYYKCVTGFLTILRCNFAYGWDYHRQMCVPKSEVKCYGNSKLRVVQ